MFTFVMRSLALVGQGTCQASKASFRGVAKVATKAADKSEQGENYFRDYRKRTFRVRKDKDGNKVIDVKPLVA
jgi:hypothetical protein